jgi:hypothetical protein
MALAQNIILLDNNGVKNVWKIHARTIFILLSTSNINTQKLCRVIAAYLE